MQFPLSLVPQSSTDHRAALVLSKRQTITLANDDTIPWRQTAMRYYK